MTRAPIDALNTTTLAHRGDRNPGPWWRTASICDLPGAFQTDDLGALAPIFDQVARIGFDAVLFRTAEADITPGRAALKETVDLAHQAGLQVMARIVAAPDDQVTDVTATPPALRVGSDQALLLPRIRSAIAAGVDGVDVGLIWDDPESDQQTERAERFSQTVQDALAELATSGESTILAAEATRRNSRFFERHVTEEWFHHLRDDALYGAPWDGEEIVKRVRAAYSARDPLGHTVPWRPSIATWSKNPLQRRPRPGAWEEKSPRARSAAMNTYAASLPGAIYLPFLKSGGAVELHASASPRIRLFIGEKPKDRFRRGLASSILHLRSKYKLGSANLAFIEGLSWAHPGVVAHLSGPILVVLNTSSREVIVPSRHIPLVYSGGFLDSTDAGTNIEPESCAWFIAGRPDPVDPGTYRQ